MKANDVYRFCDELSVLIKNPAYKEWIIGKFYVEFRDWIHKRVGDESFFPNGEELEGYLLEYLGEDCVFGNG